MSAFPPAFYAMIRGIDGFSDFTGKLVSLAMLYLVATISWECFSRYFLNAPTVWVLESSYMANGSAFMLGCAYALHKGAHVRTDMLYEKFFLPMLAPVATGLGYDMVWFGTITAVVLQTAFLSPPVAMSAYYLKQVVKEWNLATIYRGMADFMVIQCVCVALVLAFPQIAMWFPQWLEAGDRLAAPALRDDDGTDSTSLERDDYVRENPSVGDVDEPRLEK